MSDLMELDLLSSNAIGLIVRGMRLMRNQAYDDEQRYNRIRRHAPASYGFVVEQQEDGLVPDERQEIARQLIQDRWQRQAIAFLELKRQEYSTPWQADIWLRVKSPYSARARARAIDALLRDVLTEMPEEDQECFICSVPYLGTEHALNEREAMPEVPTELPCGHIFGRRCILKWLADKNTCPMCREDYGDAILERMRDIGRTPGL